MCKISEQPRILAHMAEHEVPGSEGISATSSRNGRCWIWTIPVTQISERNVGAAAAARGRTGCAWVEKEKVGKLDSPGPRVRELWNNLLQKTNLNQHYNPREGQTIFLVVGIKILGPKATVMNRPIPNRNEGLYRGPDDYDPRLPVCADLVRCGSRRRGSPDTVDCIE